MGWAPRGGLAKALGAWQAAEAPVARRDAAACRAKHDEYTVTTLREDCPTGSSAAGSRSGRKRGGVQAVHSATCCATACATLQPCRRLHAAANAAKAGDGETREAADTAENTTEKQYKRWAAIPNFVWRPQIAGECSRAGKRFDCLTCDRRTR